MGLPLEILDCFRILGISPGAHPGEIRAAFRQLALSFHPDVAGSRGAEKFEAIVAAYSILKTATPEQMTEALKGAKKQSRTPRGGARRSSPFKWNRNRKKTAPPTGRKSDHKKDEGKKASSGRVRELLLERALVEAELTVARLLEKSRGTEESASKIITRLLGDHPEVRLLALRALGGKTPEAGVFAAILEMVRRREVDDEMLSLLLMPDYGPKKSRELAAALASRSPSMTEKSVLVLIRWLARIPEKTSMLSRILYHSSPRVLASALASWPSRALPDELVLIRLLKRDEEAVLVPLLRLLKTADLPSWAGPRIAALAERHTSAAVRVWAGSIVRSGNLL